MPKIAKRLGAMKVSRLVETAPKTRADIVAGIDPVARRRAARVTVEWTFKRCALTYIEGHKES